MENLEFSNTDMLILMPLYNHEDHVEEAIKSILSQKTQYSYHVLVLDDCSTDNSVAIVEKLISENPGKITLLKSEKNQKLYLNILRGYEYCKSKYYCILDPDDYWCDDLRLEKVISFFEKHLECTVYGSNIKLLHNDGTSENLIKGVEQDCIFNLEDYFEGKGYLVYTQGVAYRNTVLKDGVPQFFYDLKDKKEREAFRADSFRNMMNSDKGKIYFTPEVQAVYRITEGGIWTECSHVEQDITNAFAFALFFEHFKHKYPQMLELSYRLFNQANKDFNSYLDSADNLKHLKTCIYQYKKIKEIFSRNSEYLDHHLTDGQKLKHKLKLSLMRKLQRQIERRFKTKLL